MKKFIIKTSFFILPFMALHTLNINLYDQKEGDLVRLGYLYSNPTPKSSISNQYALAKRYTLLSEVDVQQKYHFDVITIGDSFSEQNNLGFKNFVSHKDIEVLHIDRFISGSNPIQSLISLLNSDFFNHVNADYIVLQSVERHFNNRTKEIDFDLKIGMDEIAHKINGYTKKVSRHGGKFFSDAILKIPLTNIQYSFQEKPKYAKTYKFSSTRNDLFTNSPNDLLFYHDDINHLGIKNDSLNIVNSIEVIEWINEKAKQQDIKLIMLVSPDKYDLYFNYIKNNESLNKPLFFHFYDLAQKNYINVDSYKILNEKLESERDIYFYDDTHWSPKGAKMIADEIIDIISEKR